MSFSKVKPADLKAVFITHLHGDHYYGLPGLGMSLLSENSNNLDDSVPLYAPTGLDESVRAFGLRCLAYKSINSKVFGLIYEDSHFTVKACPLRHTVLSLGFVVEEKAKRPKVNLEKMASLGLTSGPHIKTLTLGQSISVDGRIIRPEQVLDEPERSKKIVILGDTFNSDAITDLAMDADILVHEATYSNEDYHLAKSHMHSTASMAGRFAKKIRAKNLILTHFSPRSSRDDEHCMGLVEEAREAFGDENVFAANDFFKFIV